MSRTSQPELDFESVRRILDAAFVTRDLDEALEAAGAEEVSVSALRAYLRESERAREYFDRLARADRALHDGADRDEGETDATSPFERAFDDAALEATLDEVAAAPGEPEDESDYSGEGDSDDSATIISLFGGRTTTALAAAAAAALAVGVFLYTRSDAPAPERDESFRARSAASPSDDADGRTPRVQIFCVRRDGSDVRFADPGDSAGPALECPVDAELKLAYDNPTADFAFAAFFGVDADGSVYWYGPSPAAPEPVRVQTGTDEVVPVGETIRLGVNHEPGTVRVVGLFSDRRLDFERLSEILESTSPAAVFDGRRLRSEDASIRTDRATLEIAEETKP